MRQKGDTDAHSSRAGHFAAVADWRITVLALQPRLGLLPKRRTRSPDRRFADSIAIRMVVMGIRSTTKARQDMGALFSSPEIGETKGSTSEQARRVRPVGSHNAHRSSAQRHIRLEV